MDKLYLNWFEQNCAKSKEMVTEAKNYIPSGVQHNLAFNYPFPLVFTKAEGAFLYDADGNKYIDFLQAELVHKVESFLQKALNGRKLNIVTCS
jgi:glutamate-1-semialdehyde 2,1-aminomutase